MSNDNPLSQLMDTLNVIMLEPIQITPLRHEDLSKYSPEFIFKVLEQRRTQIMEIIKEGQKQGVVRKEINSKLFALMCCGVIKGIAENRSVNDSCIQKEQINILLDILCYGIRKT